MAAKTRSEPETSDLCLLLILLDYRDENLPQTLHCCFGEDASGHAPEGQMTGDQDPHGREVSI